MISWSKVEACLRKLLELMLDPVVLVVFIAPAVIGKGLSTILDQSLVNNHQLREVLGHAQFPGVFDYTLQFYSACLGFAIWMSKAVPVIVSVQTRTPDPTSQHKPILRTSYSVLTLLVCIYSGWVIFVYSPSLDVIELYVKHTIGLNDIHLPPTSSAITWLRIVVLTMAIWHFFLRRQQ